MNNVVDAKSQGKLYITGTRGYSAYEVAVLNGYEGTEEEWLASLKGDNGDPGPQGKSAYEVAVDNGFIGTEQEWTNSFLTPDGYIQRNEVVDNLTSDTVEFPLSARQGKMLELEKVDYDKFPNFFLALFFYKDSPNNTSWYVSLDGFNYSRLPGLPDFRLRDPSITYDKTNHIFYLAATTSLKTGFRLYKSTDLVNWQQYECSVAGLTGGKIWAPDLYFDNDTGILYCILSNEYSSSEVDINGTTIPAFDQYITQSINLNNLTFTAGKRIDLSDSPNRNHIDGSLSKINGKFYLIVKNEYSKVSEIFSTDDLETFTMVNNNVSGSSYPFEGQMLIETETDVYYLADAFGNERYVISKIPKEEMPDFNSKFNLIETIHDQRHGTMMYVDTPEVKKIITSLPGFNLRGCNDIEKPNMSRRAISSSTSQQILDQYCVTPNDVTLLTGSAQYTMALKNPFKEKYFSFMFAASDGASLTITHIDDYQLPTPLTIVNNRTTNESIFRIPLDYYYLMNFYHRGTQKLAVGDIVKQPSMSYFEIYSSNTVRMGEVVSLNVTLKWVSDTLVNNMPIYLQFRDSKFYPINPIAVITNGGYILTMDNNGLITGRLSAEKDELVQLTATYVARTVTQ